MINAWSNGNSPSTTRRHRLKKIEVSGESETRFEAASHTLSFLFAIKTYSIMKEGIKIGVDYSYG